MRSTGVIRIFELAENGESARLGLYASGELEERAPIAVSAPVLYAGAIAVCRPFEGRFPARAEIDVLSRILKYPGETAWASGTGADAHAAANEACGQVPMEIARGAVVVVTLSMESNIVATVKTVLDIMDQGNSPADTTLLVAYDESPSRCVKVELLLTGLHLDLLNTPHIVAETV